MNIGVVGSSDERLNFFRSLMKGHNVFRIDPNDPGGHQRLAVVDGIVFDGKTLKGQPSLISIFQSEGFFFGRREDHVPCVVRHDENGRVHLLCGRQAAAKRRAAMGEPHAGTQTLIFQHCDPAPSLRAIGTTD